MDESLVDIILILLAGLVAVSVVPQFAVEPPTSEEVTEGAQVLRPVQVAITAEGVLRTGSPERTISAQTLYDLAVAAHAEQSVELTADKSVPARLVIEANWIIQRAGRQAVTIVQAE